MTDFYYKQLTKTELEKYKAEIINLAHSAYYNLFKDHISDADLNLFSHNLRQIGQWETLFEVAQVFTCFDQNTMVGMAFFIPSGNPWKFFTADVSYIRMVSVMPNYEGQGIGKTLTAHCLSAARASGEQTIALHTSNIQKAAQHIYISMGFKMIQPLESVWGLHYSLFTLSL